VADVQPTAQPADDNPFNAPLASEGGAAPTATTPDSGNPFDTPLESEKAAEGGSGTTGEITNDVGQKVIVPKDGESFSDTLKRATAYHKSLTPEQQKAAMNAEESTIPKKAAQTMGAAGAIGVAGPAALAGLGEVVEAAPGVIREIGRQAMEFGEGKAELANKALSTFKDAYPELAKLAPKLGSFGQTAGTLGSGYAAWELFKHITGIGAKKK
jgi:hypothetical protein